MWFNNRVDVKFVVEVMIVDKRVEVKVDMKVDIKVILRVVRGVVKVEKSVGVFVVRIKGLVVFKFLVFKLVIGNIKR